MPASADSDGLQLLECFDTLSDPARVRLLRILQQHEVSVGEIARALQLPQSTVSRHLKLLHDKGWLVKRAEGTASMYQIDEPSLAEPARQVWALTQSQLGPSPTFQNDDMRLEQVLRDRRTDTIGFFGRIGGEWDALRRELFGETFTFEAILGLLPSDAIVADLGCGTCNASELLAPLVRNIIAIDREASMLDAARKRLAEFSNIEFREGDLSDLPLDDDSVDAAMVFLVMHHIDEPGSVVSEAARVLKPGGQLLIVDMVAHDREMYQHTMGHKHLGFAENTVRAWAKKARLELVRHRLLSPDTSTRGPGLFAATMRKK